MAFKSTQYALDPEFAGSAPKGLSAHFTEEALRVGVVGFVGPEGARSIHEITDTATDQDGDLDTLGINPWEKSLQQRIIEAAQKGDTSQVLKLIEDAYLDLQMRDLDDAAFQEQLDQILELVDLAAYEMEASGFKFESHDLLATVYAALDPSSGLDLEGSGLSALQAIEDMIEKNVDGPLWSASRSARLEMEELEEKRLLHPGISPPGFGL